MTTGRILSRSCTTSWTDWGHGVLVLTGDALVRWRLPEPTEAGRHLRSTASADEPPCEVPDPSDAAQILKLHPTNKYLELARVASARLRKGVLSDRLSVVETSGVTHKLLWLRADPAHTILATRLPELIGGRFAHG